MLVRRIARIEISVAEPSCFAKISSALCSAMSPVSRVFARIAALVLSGGFACEELKFQRASGVVTRIGKIISRDPR
jgi:hypothetical protein